jgi:hypothetical protein
MDVVYHSTIQRAGAAVCLKVRRRRILKCESFCRWAYSRLHLCPSQRVVGSVLGSPFPFQFCFAIALRQFLDVFHLGGWMHARRALCKRHDRNPPASATTDEFFIRLLGSAAKCVATHDGPLAQRPALKVSRKRGLGYCIYTNVKSIHDACLLLASHENCCFLSLELLQLWTMLFSPPVLESCPHLFSLEPADFSFRSLPLPPPPINERARLLSLSALFLFCLSLPLFHCVFL